MRVASFRYVQHEQQLVITLLAIIIKYLSFL